MKINNPYYIENSNNYTDEQLLYMKENNFYILTILSHIIKHNGKTETISPNYRKKILSGKLYHSDAKTGIDTNGLGEKLKALYIALDKEENRRVFCNSFFYTAMTIITSGNTSTESTDKEWKNYKQTSACPVELQGKKPFAAAMEIYKQDPKTNIGLDMAKIFDTIVQKTASGKYLIKDTTAAQGDILYTAACEQVEALKSHPVFKRSFYNEKEFGIDQEQD